MILNKRTDKSFKRKQAIKNWWFKLFKLRKMRKRIRKVYYKEQLKHKETLSEITVYAHIFKYSKEQIERGLELFKQRGELKDYRLLKIGDSKDAYTLVFFDENRSQSILKTPDVVDLNKIELQPINQAESTASKAEEPTITQPF